MESGNLLFGIRTPNLWNPETFSLESGNLLFAIPEKIIFEIRNPLRWNLNLNPVPGIQGPHKGTRNPGRGIWNPQKSYLLEFGIHWGGILNPIPGIGNQRHGIRNPRLSRITLYGAIFTFHCLIYSENYFTLLTPFNHLLILYS